jgi:hypothetical protein
MKEQDASLLRLCLPAISRSELATLGCFTTKWRRVQIADIPEPRFQDNHAPSVGGKKYQEV